MPVYVDQSIKRLGQLRTCRMVADTPEELLSMVDSLGIRKKRIQMNLPIRHVKLCDTERTRVIELGAKEVTCVALSKAFMALNLLPSTPSLPTSSS